MTLEPALSEEQSAFMEVVDRLAGRHVLPRAPEIDERAVIPDDLRDLLTASELHHIDGPLEHGGSGGDLATALMLTRQVARSSGAVATTVSASHIYAAACRFSEEPPWDRVERVARGSWPALIRGSDEPIRAAADADGFVLDGEATAAEEPHRHEGLLVLAEDGGSNLLALEVPARIAEIGPSQRRTGLRGVDRRRVRFEAARTGRESLLGGEAAAVAASNWAVLGAAAVAVGIAEAALAASVAYVRDRQQFGQPIAEFPGLRAIVTEMDLMISAAASTLHLAGSSDDALEAPGAARAARSAILAARAAVAVAVAAVQLHGGYGYMTDFPVERLMRDAISARARTCTLTGIRLIASSVLGPPAVPG
jgi:alkylation response protein AidB-like acyl-CoA dehydrogenase